ncbi:MAG: right-handed parallel beta-helix repeat-containing protein, partial [Methanophagales archaeon]|nr:right-handed parallel beta-helix repeat-containing protein [Methanophagales archaeon]
NTLTNNNASNNEIGIFLQSYSSHNTLANNTANSNIVHGICLESSSNNNLTNNTANNNNYGIILSTSSNSTLKNNTASNNINYDFYSSQKSHNNTVKGLTISSIASYPTTISFTYDNGIKIKGVKTAPSNPDGKLNVGKYVNATNVTANSWLFLNVSYTDADLGTVDEDSLRMWKYNFYGSWTEVPPPNGVNTVEKYVYANITSFSIFAPLSEKAALTLGNITNITQDWGIDFRVNHSVTAKNATAYNVTLNYSYWLTNTTWSSIIKDSMKWQNQSMGNNTVANNSIEVFANATDANNASGTFWINITKRDIGIVASPEATQTIDPDEIFWINGSGKDEYGDELIGKADLVREGIIVETKDITSGNGNANFSRTEPLAGSFNFSIRFYNLSHYNNATTSNSTITVRGPTLELGNVSNITEHWGRDFNLNHSFSVTHANASNVNVSYNVSWISNCSLGTVNRGEKKWCNQTVSNSTVQNVTVKVNANSTNVSAVNDSETFWINITRRDIEIIANPAGEQTVDPDDTFWINATAKDEYDDELTGKADLIREGISVETKDITSGNANFSRSEPLAGTFNFSIRFYNLTHYNNATTSNSSVTVIIPVNITTYAPESPVNDTVCNWRTFNVTVNQTVNMSWYLNGTAQISKNESVTEANYTFHAQYVGVHNVSAVAENANGTDMQAWDWNVTAAPTVAPNITSFAPSSPVSDTEGATRTFNITIDQTVNVSWQINGTEVFNQTGVIESAYTNTSAAVGTWNVSAIATNANGTDIQTWTWNVWMLGDLNHNDRIDTGDATLVLRMIVGLTHVDYLGDMNGNGRIDTGDATIILRIIVGLPV